jgi:CobQ-like glutamine amidotransferase family enzyme
VTVADERFVILQLYPDELGVTGDRGNVLALATRLERAGATVELVMHQCGDTLPSEPDIVVIGNGPLSAVRTILDDLLVNAAIIQGWVRDGVPLIAVGAGMEALGESITTPDGERLPAASVLPLTTIRGLARRVGYVVLDSGVGEVVGFEDHRSSTVLTSGSPFARVTAGVSSLRGGSDGVVFYNAIGTNAQGPVLPLNPVVTEHLISLAVARRGLSWQADANHRQLDRLAAEARAVIIANIDNDFSSI